MLLVASSASAVVRIVMVGFLIACDGERRRELTASIRHYAVGAMGIPHPVRMVRAAIPIWTTQISFRL
jgi:hypothetical protein